LCGGAVAQQMDGIAGHAEQGFHDLLLDLETVIYAETAGPAPSLASAHSRMVSPGSPFQTPKTAHLWPARASDRANLVFAIGRQRFWQLRPPAANSRCKPIYESLASAAPHAHRDSASVPRSQTPETRPPAHPTAQIRAPQPVQSPSRLARQPLHLSTTPRRPWSMSMINLSMAD
jgi:hypothetical protein